MALLNFPDLPVLDEEWTSPIGTVYRWDGVVWVSVGGGGGVSGGGGGGAGGLTVVTHDATLDGDGTVAIPLTVVPGAASGIPSVTHDLTLVGDGTTVVPLAVANALDAGVF
jgi:hypothetical protein